MQTRHEIPVADGERVVAVHHEPDDVGETGGDDVCETGGDDVGETGGNAGQRDCPGDADTWLVFCHGFLSDRSGSYEGRCRRAAAEGYHAVRFDFRGCGEADGAFVDQTLSDKIADLRAVVEHFEPARLVLFGSSFGAKVALHAAPDLAGADDVELVALAGRAPVTDNRSFADTRAAIERDGTVTVETGQSVDERFVDDLETHPFGAVVDASDDLDCPILLVHGADDESVPIDHSFEAAAALETDVLLEKVQDEGHRFSEAAERQLRTRLFDWLASLD